MTCEMPAKVLIVEDEGMVAMLLEDMLTDLGHEVVATVGEMDRALNWSPKPRSMLRF